MGLVKEPVGSDKWHGVHGGVVDVGFGGCTIKGREWELDPPVPHRERYQAKFDDFSAQE